MTRIRIIAVFLLATAYFAVTFGNALRVIMPSLGSGCPSIHHATGRSKEVPRPNWTPRRHLPLVKLPSFDQLAATPRLPAGACDCSGPHLLSQVEIGREEHSGPPSCTRAPPSR